MGCNAGYNPAQPSLKSSRGGIKYCVPRIQYRWLPASQCSYFTQSDY